MTDELPEGVEVDETHDAVAASTLVPGATPADVFDYVRRPANHAAISGDHSVQSAIKGPEVLGEGDRFGMAMKLGLPYRISSKVEEFDQDRRIAWAHLGGHRWRWEVEAVDGGTKVTETFDMTTAKVPPVLRLAGYPHRHAPNVARSVANVRDHFAGAQG